MIESVPAIVPAHLAQLFAPRPRDANKGTFGTVAIVGGAAGMSGAWMRLGKVILEPGAAKMLRQRGVKLTGTAGAGGWCATA